MIDVILCGLVVGISLGLTGGGGSIFAVPLLLFVLGVPLRESVVVSLAVVGLTAIYGAIFQRQMVQWGAGAMLGVGGVLGAPLGALLGVHLPESLTLLLFAALMVFIGVNMWRSGSAQEIPLSPFACRRDANNVLRFHWSCAGKLLFAGALTGVLSGIFGVGGGFLVVPALLLVTGMPIERALATSLVGIFLISSAALAANFLTIPAFPLFLALWFLLGGTLGMTLGATIKSRLPSLALKKVFAVAMLAVAAWIVGQSVFTSVPTETPERKGAIPQDERTERERISDLCRLGRPEADSVNPA